MRFTILLTLPILAFMTVAAAAQADEQEGRIRILEDRLKTLEERYSVTVQSLHAARLEAAIESEVVRKLKVEVERQAAILAQIQKTAPGSVSVPVAPAGAAAPDSIDAFERSTFARNAAGSAYRGPVRLPDFAGRDRDYANYRTRLRTGMGQGANFAGSLAMVEIGCGTSCRFAFAGDVRTGQVYSFPIGGEEYYSLDLRYNVESRAVIAYWISNQRCTRAVFTWTGTNFAASGQSDIGDTETCYRLQQR
ncbi:hypothetical protein [Bosea sp. UC22_33]|uniref:hypothetical protein n=1 Tax=Bosea sp. UC22_33 TaxID=3350165 RepID=UPI003670A8CA